MNFHPHDISLLTVILWFLSRGSMWPESLPCGQESLGTFAFVLPGHSLTPATSSISANAQQPTQSTHHLQSTTFHLVSPQKAHEMILIVCFNQCSTLILVIRNICNKYNKYRKVKMVTAGRLGVMPQVVGRCLGRFRGFSPVRSSPCSPFSEPRA